MEKLLHAVLFASVILAAPVLRAQEGAPRDAQGDPSAFAFKKQGPPGGPDLMTLWQIFRTTWRGSAVGKKTTDLADRSRGDSGRFKDPIEESVRFRPGSCSKERGCGWHVSFGSEMVELKVPKEELAQGVEAGKVYSLRSSDDNAVFSEDVKLEYMAARNADGVLVLSGTIEHSSSSPKRHVTGSRAKVRFQAAPVTGAELAQEQRDHEERLKKHEADEAASRQRHLSAAAAAAKRLAEAAAAAPRAEESALMARKFAKVGQDDLAWLVAKGMVDSGSGSLIPGSLDTEAKLGGEKTEYACSFVKDRRSGPKAPSEWLSMDAAGALWAAPEAARLLPRNTDCDEFYGRL